MSNRQRLTYLAIAAVIAIAAVVVFALGGDGDDEADVAATTTPAATATATPDASADETPTPTPTPTPTATPKPQPPLLRAGRSRTLTFKSGDTVRFRVRNPTAEEIHVHGYDIERAVPAGKTITVSFKANLEGIYEVEFHGTGEKIASLKVEP